MPSKGLSSIDRKGQGMEIQRREPRVVESVIQESLSYKRQKTQLRPFNIKRDLIDSGTAEVGDHKVSLGSICCLCLSWAVVFVRLVLLVVWHQRPSHPTCPQSRASCFFGIPSKHFIAFHWLWPSHMAISEVAWSESGAWGWHQLDAKHIGQECGKGVSTEARSLLTQ